MKRYDCYYTNDFGSDYPASSKETDDGDWVSFEDAQAEIAKADEALRQSVAVISSRNAQIVTLRNDLTATNLERDALRTGIKTLQSTCCGSDDPCNGCRALLKLSEVPS